MNITELLTDLASNTNAIIRAAASNLNLTSSQAFHLLSIPFDGIPMSGLAHKLGLDNSTLTRNIQKMEGLGLIKRKRGLYDKRVQTILLTSLGSRTVQKIESRLQDINHVLVEGLDMDAQEKLLDALEQLVWSMDCLREK